MQAREGGLGRERFIPFNTVAVGVMVVGIVIAHLVAPAAYSWTRRTISQLGAQGYEHAGITRLTFGLFGVLIVMGAANRARRARTARLRLVEIPLGVYGIGIAVAAVFSTSPFIAGVAYSPGEARLHSIAATAAGVGLSLAALGYALVDEPARRRIVHLAAFVAIIAISALVGTADVWAGVLQRCLWAVGFAWLLFVEWRRPPEEAVS